MNHSRVLRSLLLLLLLLLVLLLLLLLLLHCLQVRIKHKDTNTYLSSNKDLMFGQPIHGHLEVCGVPSKGKDTEWFAAEGVYLPRTDASNKSKDAAAAAGKDEEKDEL
jgi:hypothetical protein